MPERVRDNVLAWGADIIEQATIEQAAKTARLPFVAGHLALMPDAHIGKGSTVGSVIPTSGAIIPAAIGVDIGCGMAAIRFDMVAGDLPSLQDLMPEIEKAVPAGVGQGHLGERDFNLRNKLGDSYFLHELKETKVESTAISQCGSLGSGNHFFEICLDEDDGVWMVLHSGSRGVGNKMASYHIEKAKGLMKEYFIKLEDPDLAYFAQGTPEMQRYLQDMHWAQDYAALNRSIMLKNAKKAFVDFVFSKTGFTPSEMEVINCHHNFTQMESVCITCQDNSILNSEHPERVFRLGELKSKVLSFLADCQIDRHSCGGLVLTSSQDGQEVPPSLADALARNLCYLPSDDPVSSAGYSRNQSQPDPLCSCPSLSRTSKTTSERMRGNNISAIADRLLPELETLGDTLGKSPLWSFLDSFSPDSPSLINHSVNCGGKLKGHQKKNLYITRKGAVKAAAGDRGIIPGSMGTGTYIVTGLGNPASYNSSSHGAGRVFSRSAAKKRYDADDLRDRMKGKVWNSDRAEGLVDEIPDAYKDLDKVMDAQSDLVRIDHKLSPIFNYKG